MLDALEAFQVYFETGGKKMSKVRVRGKVEKALRKVDS